jgi:hypothetical protein
MKKAITTAALAAILFATLTASTRKEAQAVEPVTATLALAAFVNSVYAFGNAISKRYAGECVKHSCNVEEKREWYRDYHNEMIEEEGGTFEEMVELMLGPHRNFDKAAAVAWMLHDFRDLGWEVKSWHFPAGYENARGAIGGF